MSGFIRIVLLSWTASVLCATSLHALLQRACAGVELRSWLQHASPECGCPLQRWHSWFSQSAVTLRQHLVKYEPLTCLA